MYRQIPALEAESRLGEINVAIMPHVKDKDRQRHVRHLKRIAGHRKPKPNFTIKEHDPEKAKAYFESIGVKVKHDASQL